MNWTRDPQEALDLMVELNHRYALDGSDPNSYGGLLWCLGMFDRPFTPEQPVFGSVRTRPTNHHQKRLDMTKYTAHVQRPSGSKHLKTAIIGAGLSGLVAGQSLAKNGNPVQLFDKSRGPGGRMATRRVDNLAFDHGAQYFTARSDQFRRQVNEWVKGGIAAEWGGRIGVIDKGAFTVREAGPERYVGVPRMSALSRHLSTSLDISFNTRIKETIYESDMWSLVDDTGQTLGPYDRLIITTPPNQAIPFLSDSPTLSKRVGDVIMRPCWAVMLSFADPLDVPLDGGFVHNSPLSWVCRNNSKPDRSNQETWVLHSSPDWAEKHLELTVEEILPLLLKAFEAAIGKELEPAHFARAHRWRYALASNPRTEGVLWDEKLKLVVCGDWCNSSRIEGAYLSGLAAAGRLMGIPDAVQEHNAATQLSFPGL